MKTYTIRKEQFDGGVQTITAHEVRGHPVHLEGIPKDIELFSHKDGFGRFRISEASSGYALTRWELQLKGARVAAEINAGKVGIDKLREMISEACKN